MPHTATTLSRVDQVDAVAEAISEVYDLDHRILNAQLTMEFEEGIVIANDVMADFVADLHHLMDYHGQDFDALLLSAQAKYEAHREAVES